MFHCHCQWLTVAILLNLLPETSFVWRCKPTDTMATDVSLSVSFPPRGKDRRCHFVRALLRLPDGLCEFDVKVVSSRNRNWLVRCCQKDIRHDCRCGDSIDININISYISWCVAGDAWCVAVDDTWWHICLPLVFQSLLTFITFDIFDNIILTISICCSVCLFPFVT